MARPLPLQLGFAPLGAIALLALCTGCHSEPTVVDPVSGRTGLPRDSLTAFRAAAGWPPPPAPPAAAFRFANTLGDSMVMQQAPAGAVIWGFAPPGAAVAVYSTHPEVRRQQQEGPARAVAAANGSWLVHLPPAAGSFAAFNITATSPGQPIISLANLLYGDVWVCGGQSNMQFALNQDFNGATAIADAAKYPGIRLFTPSPTVWSAGNATAPGAPFAELKAIEQPWSVASPAAVGGGPGRKAFSTFSAVCWYFAKATYDELNATGAARPLGLIASSWGGTIIETWMDPIALHECCPENGTRWFPEQQAWVCPAAATRVNRSTAAAAPNQEAPSALWNSMIVPLLRTPIFGVVWYQGESDSKGVYPGATHEETKNYACAFPALIKSWRRHWHMMTGGHTDRLFPFGFVQLSTWSNADNKTCGDKPACPPHVKTDACPGNSCNVALLRWGQTAAVGHVPNDKMPATFMAVAIDQGDGLSPNPWGDIHTRNKKTIGERLALAGQPVSYPKSSRYTLAATTGPLVIGATTVASVGGEAAVSVAFNGSGKTSFELRAKTGFETSPLPCDFSFPAGTTTEGWVPATVIEDEAPPTLAANGDYIVTIRPGGKCVRYNWYNAACSPTAGTGLCAVYGTYAGSIALPSPPFIIDVVPAPVGGARPPVKSDDGTGAGRTQTDADITIRLARPVAAVGRGFVGHAWDYSPEGNQSVLRADLSSPRLINLVKNLAGVSGSVLRIGGGAGDCAVYQMGPKPYPVVECGVNEWAAGGKQYNAPCTSSCPGSNISGVSWCLTPHRWDALHAFAKKTGLKILYGLNGFHGQGGKHAPGGWRQAVPWDPTNVDALLAYSAEQKLAEEGTLLGFEMGNEITENEVSNGSYWGDRFVQLASLVRKHWPDPTDRPGLFGPDQTRSGNYGCKSCFPNWTKAFLDRAAPVLAGVTFHAYPGHSQGATPAHLDHCDILNNGLLQKTLNIAAKWDALVQRYRPGGSTSPSVSLPLILGEASACSGGGAAGISDRFAISFWYADTLGAMARLGVRGMNRQAILSNNYSLIDIDRHGIVHQSHVHPDYYIAWFWGRLMGAQVLGVDNPKINTTGLRVYAHCTASRASDEGGSTTVGAVSVVAININANASVSLNTGLKGSYRVFSITGADGRGVQADSINVNGKAFAVQSGPAATMPPLRGTAGAEGAPFAAPAHSISFLVFDSAAARACSFKPGDANAEDTVTTSTTSTASTASSRLKTDDNVSYLVDPAFEAPPAATTSATPTVHMPNSYAFSRTTRNGSANPLHGTLYRQLRELNADTVRYMQAQDTNGLNALELYPEPCAPDATTRTTSWDMSGIEQYVVDFCAATRGGDCHETVVFIGPLPPWFFFDKPNSKTVCNATTHYGGARTGDSHACAGFLVDPTAVTAGEYYSRIISYFNDGSFVDEFGKRHVFGGKRLNITNWEVLNEPNLYPHYAAGAGGSTPIATYTTVYDGVVSVLARDHPKLRFAAMSWAPPIWSSDFSMADQLMDFTTFMDRRTHKSPLNLTLPWPPRYITFHFYSSPTDQFGETLREPLALASQVAAAVKKQLPTTELFLSELGIFGCPHPANIQPGGSYSSTLENGPSRVEFWNSRAAWFASVYARLAEMGVAAMGASQFFGFDTPTAERFGWLGPEGQCSNGGANENPYCGYPCLSSLNWDDASPNPRYHTLKMLIQTMRGAETKQVFHASVISKDQPSSASPLALVAAAAPAGSSFRQSLTCPEARNVSENQGIVLNDMGSLTHPSWAANATLGFEQCTQACCEEPGCAAMMYEQASQFDGYKRCTLGQPCCWLKHATAPWEPRPKAEGTKTGILRYHDHKPKPVPPPPPPPPPSLFTATGFKFSDGARRLLVVNGANHSATVTVKWSGGAAMAVIDAEHGHGLSPPAETQIQAAADGELMMSLGRYAIAVLSSEPLLSTAP